MADGPTKVRRAYDEMVKAHQRCTQNANRYRDAFIYAARRFVREWREASPKYVAELERRAVYVQQNTSRDSDYGRAVRHALHRIATADENIPAGLRARLAVIQKPYEQERDDPEQGDWLQHYFAAYGGALSEETKLWDNLLRAGRLGDARLAVEAVLNAGEALLREAAELAVDGAYFLMIVSDDSDDPAIALALHAAGAKADDEKRNLMIDTAASIVEWASDRSYNEAPMGILEQTPRATGRTPRCESSAVKLFGHGEEPEVHGKRKPRLTQARYDVVQTLIEAGENGLTKDQLDERSGRTEARKRLYELVKSDEDWARAISLPGTTGKRYRIR